MVAAQGLPGGATLLNETHDNWTVACRIVENKVRCAMTQSQVGGEKRQRVLAIELSTGEGRNTASGVLVLPFGLRLDAGARIAIEKGPAMAPLRFSTCVPGGCLVPLTFDAAMVTALKSSKALSVSAKAHDSGKEVSFSIPLSGFTSALGRVAELNGSNSPR